MDRRTGAKTGSLIAWRLAAVLLLGGLMGYHAVLFANEDDAVTISGMSLIGNDEAPKSLFIVPWKSSEIGSDTSLTSGLLDDSMRPVDRDVFMREIDFYEIRHAN
jgi:hypothetical protein